MFTTLIAVVIALGLGHLVPKQTACFRSYSWLGYGLKQLKKINKSPSFWETSGSLIVTLLVPLVVVWGIQGIVGDGFFGLLFSIMVLTYTWGPRDLDRDVESILDTQDIPSRDAAVRHLLPHQNPLIYDETILIRALAKGALQRWFCIIFWFLLLGPIGAVAYRLLVLIAQDEYASYFKNNAKYNARKLMHLMEYPVAHLMAFSMGLVGNFDAAYKVWKLNYKVAGLNASECLEAVTQATVKSGSIEQMAFDSPIHDMVPELDELNVLRDTMSLIWRVLLLWLSILSILIIAGWIS